MKNIKAPSFPAKKEKIVVEVEPSPAQAAIRTILSEQEVTDAPPGFCPPVKEGHPGRLRVSLVLGIKKRKREKAMIQVNFDKQDVWYMGVEFEDSHLVTNKNYNKELGISSIILETGQRPR